ncbi:tetratricopeptide repeat protein [Alteribacter aurantiacus]|uniref:tetratricopeptide repeat protein n=1 Tax=Alteribacter aurantiacus TaxID=254410 RepID=UPI00041CB6F9|nr:tetratricopeptide repeat protein [Alteribacter aurantiacus]
MIANKIKPLNIGKFVLQKRIEKGLTQEELVSGICSITYLSKLENNKLEGSEEITGLLLERIGVDLYNIEELTSQFKQDCNHLYNAINDMNVEEAERYFQKVFSYESVIMDTELHIYIRLLSLRYYLFTKDPRAYECVENLKKYKKTFDTDQLFYFHYFQGIYLIQQSSLNDSLREFEKAYEILQDYSLKDESVYYFLALCYSRLKKVRLAIFFSEKAVGYFQQIFNYKRVIDIHIILGINYTRVKKYQEALDLYDHIGRLALNYKDYRLLSSIYHNVAYTHSKLKDHNKAIHYYKESLKYKDKEDQSYVNTIYYLAKEYLNVQSAIEADKQLEQGLGLSVEKNVGMYYKLFILRLNNGGEVKDQDLQFIESKVIPYLYENGDFQTLKEAYALISGVYEDQNKYKKANEYLKKLVTLLEREEVD